MRNVLPLLLLALSVGGCRQQPAPPGEGGQIQSGTDVAPQTETAGVVTPPQVDAPPAHPAVTGPARAPEATVTEKPAELPPERPTGTPPLGTDEPELLGQPLSHWTDRAVEEEAAERRAETVRALTAGAEHGKVWVRVASADALRVMGPDAAPAVDALIANFESDEAWVRTSSMDAILAVGPAAVPTLTEAFAHGRGRRRFLSALALGSLGPAAKSALPTLQKALTEETGELHARLIAIMAQIQAEPDGSGAGGSSAGTAHLIDVPQGAAVITPTETEDWPQFHGPRRDAICTETGLLKQWPPEGPPLLWSLQGLGKGFSTVSISNGKLYTMGDLAGDGAEAAQMIMAFDLKSREMLWVAYVGAPHADGPRCTPTVDADRVYALGTSGNLLCVEAETGEMVWQKNMQSDFGGRMMSDWKYSESPLVDGDKLVCTPGAGDAMLVALDKTTGDVIWSCDVPEIGTDGKDGAGYSSIVVAEIAGVRQYVQMVGRGLIGVEAETGRFLWGYNRIANKVANIPMPVVRGDYVFCTTSYRSGSALLHITRDGDTLRAEEVYSLGPERFENHHGGMVLIGNSLYGGNGQNRGGPACLKFATGDIAWKPRRAPAYGSAAVLYADGNLIFRYDRGPVALIEATPDEYRVNGLFTPDLGDGPAWAHPVIHDGKLYLRHGDLLACYDLRAP